MSATMISPTFDELIRSFVDITAPNEPVEVRVDKGRGVLWVNVGAVCVLRICRAPTIEVAL